jgi:hypothetical protein
MRSIGKRWIYLSLTAAAAAFAPVSVQPAALLAGTMGSSEVIRITRACGQATECKEAKKYLCSTHHGNEKDYECSKGCEDVIE